MTVLYTLEQLVYFIETDDPTFISYFLSNMIPFVLLLGQHLLMIIKENLDHQFWWSKLFWSEQSVNISQFITWTLNIFFLKNKIHISRIILFMLAILAMCNLTYRVASVLTITFTVIDQRSPTFYHFFFWLKPYWEYSGEEMENGGSGG